ncbi:hypothetical protein CLV30_106144 [Haloactinopolyspora alba]|uniref:Phage minor structural protein n=1 Tax=Haloactinopolyspora alba TaxID=648780 RepID=A0A2P8E3V1_9ACTN|nr:hypothetical protein [Haloactinopolyspora alba]PSL04139.1 hypothetical protein CLV30_106144 [Haloactinopolyspora alba]
MTFDIRLVAYEPDGARLGVLHHPTSTSTSLPLNDRPALDLSYTRGLPGSEWLESFCEVAVEWNTGADWTEPPNGRFIRLAWSADHLDEAKSLKLSMPGYSWLLRTAQVRGKSGHMDEDGRRQFVDATPGEILRTLLEEAQARGCVPGMSWDISDASDSDGEPWVERLNLSFDVGMKLDQVLSSLADQGAIDWNFWGRELHVYNADTLLARDLTTRDNPVNLRSGLDITSAPDKGDASGLIHRALLRGEDGLRVEVSNPAAVSPWGEFEVTIDQGGVSDEGTAILLAEKTLREGERERIQMTRGLIFAASRWIVLRDYRPGDWIYAPGVDGAKTRARIRSLTLSKDANGVVQGNLTLNDRFIEASVKAAQRARDIAGGASSNGGTGTKPQPPPPTDVGQDTRAANAPQGFMLNSQGYINSAGIPRGLIEAEWAAVTTATDGTNIEIVRYDLYGRPLNSEQNWFRLARVDGTHVAHSPFDVGEVWQFKVCAVAQYAGAGEFSEILQVEIADDEIPPPAPSTPVLSSRLGTVRVEWDGQTFDGAGMPRDLSHIEVHVGSDPAFTPTPASLVDTLVGERNLTVLTDLPYNTDVHVAFVAVDRSDNSSDPSGVSTIQVQPLVDTDIIGEIIDSAHIKDGTLVASEKIVGETITGGLIQALAIEAGHIAANAITADKIAAGSITAEKLRIGSVTPSQMAGAGVNRVSDPGFEDLDYWTAVGDGETAMPAAVGAWAVRTSYPRRGARSLECDPTPGSSTMYLTPELPIPASRRIYVSGWGRTAGSGGITGPDSFLRIYIQVVHDDGSTTYHSRQIGQTGATFSWENAEGTLTVPDTAVHYQAYLAVRNHSGTDGRYIVDDVIVQDAVGQDTSDRVQIDPSGLRVYSGANERIRIDSQGIAAWNGSGQQTVEISSGGSATFTGTFRTGWATPRVEIRETGLDNPAVYFYPETAGDWYTAPNILGWDNGSSTQPSPSLHLNSGVPHADARHNQFQLQQARGEFRIGNGLQGYPVAYAHGDGSWAFGINGGDNSGVNGAVVRGRSDGSWGIGRDIVFINDGAGDGHMYLGANGDINLTPNLRGRDYRVDVNGLLHATSVTSTIKNFRIPHPTKPGMDLLHASTESPVSGIEYWGSATLDERGEAVVELPNYFEALAKTDNRTALVTPHGAPVEWTAVMDGRFTVTGQAGQSFSWLVKAERHGADFDIEQETRTPDPDRDTGGGWGQDNNQPQESAT